VTVQPRVPPQELGQQLASAAANGDLQQAYTYSEAGRLYQVFRVEFGGGTAGRFGAAMEVRCVTVAQVGGCAEEGEGGGGGLD
jgi:hypothetical protein